MTEGSARRAPRPETTRPGGGPGRWRRQPEARPQQILEAALRVFGARGLDGATLEQVARDAGISKGTIYLYYPDKRALVTAMLRTRTADLLPAATGDIQTGGSAQAQLRRTGRRLYRLFASPTFLGRFRTAMGAAPQYPEAAATLFWEGLLPVHHRLAQLVQAGIDGGDFRDVDPLIVARAFVGMLQSFAVTHSLLDAHHPRPLSSDRVVGSAMDLLVHGLLVPAGGRRRPSGALRSVYSNHTA